MRIRVTIELSEEQVYLLAYKNIRYQREDPRKRWSKSEYKESAKDFIAKMVYAKLTKIKETS